MPESTAGFAVQRVNRLTEAFRAVGETRMQGVPVLHPGLHVEAVAFEAFGNGALGVLVTPWFMNLMWLPSDDAEAIPVGTTRVRELGGERLEFIGALEASFGAYEMCSLFSPMSDFADQDAARETACEVLRLLRKPLPKPDVTLAPSRRAFLTGRLSGRERT